LDGEAVSEAEGELEAEMEDMSSYEEGSEAMMGFEGGTIDSCFMSCESDS
jgi:hypothetical protein